MHSPIHWFFRLKVQCYLKALSGTFEAAFEKPVSMWYQTFCQKSIKRAPQVTGYHWVPFSIDSFQGWGNMKPCEKSIDRFRNLLIILSRLCYTFIHSMSLRFVIVFWRLNYTKTIGFMLFLCQLLLNFQGAKAHFNVRSLSQ